MFLCSLGTGTDEEGVELETAEECVERFGREDVNQKAIRERRRKKRRAVSRMLCINMLISSFYKFVSHI